MKNLLRWVVLAMCSASTLAFAQANVGIVNQINGDVKYQGAKDAAPHKLQAFAQLRHGDKITVPAGAEIKISYFAGNRQETWKGAANFVATTEGGELLKGNKPEVAKLPGMVSQKLARVPELMGTSRIGGIVVRSLSAATDKGQREKEVSEAMAAYESMRSKSGESDITPELFIISVLLDNEMYADVKWVADEISKRQPNNTEYRQFASWALSQQKLHNQ
jgi:hypothetical protein